MLRLSRCRRDVFPRSFYRFWARGASHVYSLFGFTSVGSATEDDKGQEKPIQLPSLDFSGYSGRFTAVASFEPAVFWAETFTTAGIIEPNGQPDNSSLITDDKLE